MITSTNVEWRERRNRALRSLFAVVALVLSGLILTDLAPAARAGETPMEEVSSDELAAREGVTNPNTVPSHSMHERVFRVPIDGDGPRLIVTLLTPDGPGPFPLAVINHGATAAIPPAQQVRHYQTFAAYYFLSRGYAVVLPMMRGYAGSEGLQRRTGCALAELGIANARDINDVIDAMARRPEIDASRVVVAGQSFGGWNTLAFGTLGRKGVAGLVNFNGGIQMSYSYGGHTSICRNENSELFDDAGTFAAATHVPSIWFYGETDTLFRPEVWHAMYASYVAKGGQAELADIGSFFTDSHQFLAYPEALPIWVPRLDAFLERIGMPHSPVFPDYLPRPWPKPSGYAALDNVDKVPYLTDAGRKLYRDVFLTHKLPRALAISANGSVSAQFGGFDQVTSALNSCQARSKTACRIYAIDSDVIWQPFPDPPPPSHYAALQDAGAIPYLGQAKFDFYAKFLARPGPRALMISPDGKAYGAYGVHAFEQAMTNCQAHSARCEPYVVNDDVVWSGPGK